MPRLPTRHATALSSDPFNKMFGKQRRDVDPQESIQQGALIMRHSNPLIGGLRVLAVLAGLILCPALPALAQAPKAPAPKAPAPKAAAPAKPAPKPATTPAPAAA